MQHFLTARSCDPKKGTRKAVPVSIQGLSQSFEGNAVYADVSLDVKEGEIFAIMGPSGAGKSILLRTLIGLNIPSCGKVFIAGKDASLPETHSEFVTSMVFQAGGLFNSMTVFDNLALYPREHRLYDARILQEKVMSTLKMLSLEKSAHQMPSELSGGMRKRVAIARALMMEPELILYDEPTSELDPLMSSNIAEIIATLREQVGVTSIVVTHDRDLAFGIADRVAIMARGRIIAIGTPQEIRDHPDPFIQDFLNPHIDLIHPRFRKDTV